MQGQQHNRETRWLPALCCSVAVLAGLGCNGGSNDSSAKHGNAEMPITGNETPPPAAPPPTPPSPLPVYPATEAGLSDLARDLIEAAKTKNEQQLARLLQSLRLDEPAPWFIHHFGTQLGPILAADYQQIHDNIGVLAQVLAEQIKLQATKISVEKFTGAPSPQATGYQNALMAKMIDKTALYSVRLSTLTGRNTLHLWSFVVADERFRYLGKLKNVSDVPRPKGRDLFEFRTIDATRIQTP